MDPTITAIGSAIAMVIGFFLKSKPDFYNKNVPWVTLIISFLTQIISASTVHAASGFIGGLGGMFFDIFKNTLAQWLLTTGTVSVTKNAILRK